MADKITFSKTLNTSVQVGDELYYSDISGASPTNPISIGEITEKGDKWVEVANGSVPAGFGADSDANKVINGEFDDDIDGWVLEGSIASSTQTVNGECSGGSYDDDKGECIIHGDCDDGTSDVESANCVSSCSDNTSLDKATCETLGDCNDAGVITTGTTESTCLEFGDCYDYVISANIPSVTQATCDSLGAFYELAGSCVSPNCTEWTAYNIWTANGVWTDRVWTAYEFYFDPSVYWDASGRMYLDSLQGMAKGFVSQTIGGIEIGGEYSYSFDYNVVSGGDVFFYRDNPGNTQTLSGSDTYTETFIGTSTDITLWIYGSTNDPGFAYIDNVSIIDTSLRSDLFFMFRKPVAENISSLKGYFAEVEFSNGETSKQELFAVGSEVTISSK